MNSTDVTEEIGVGIDISIPTTIIYIIFGLLGIVGNGLVIFVFLRMKELQDITNLLIVNQSLIDFTSSVLLIAIFVVPLPPLPKENEVLARFICGFWYTQYPFWSSYAATIWNLVILTLERFLAVVYPIQYRNKASVPRAMMFALIPWVYGFLHMSYLIPMTDVEDGTCFQFMWPNNTMQPAMGVYTFFILFLAPFSLMTFLYYKIVRVLRQGVGQSASDPTSVHQTTNLRQQARKNIVKTMLILCVCYGICWAPNNIIYLYYCLGGYVDFNGVLYYTTVWISFVNIWINPLVYTLQYRKFQHGLKVAFCSCRSRTDETSGATISTIVKDESVL